MVLRFVSPIALASTLWIGAACGADDGSTTTRDSTTRDSTTQATDASPSDADGVATDTSPSDADGVATDTGPPATLPAFSELGLFNAANPFNQAIGPSPTVHPASATMVRSLIAAGSFVVQRGQYSATVFFSDDAAEAGDVFIHCGAVWELGVDTLADVRVPTWAVAADDADGADNPAVGCGEDADQDNFLVIIDRTRGCEYDLWQARPGDGGWEASWAVGTPLDGDGVFPGGVSSRGSGFAFAAGMLWPDEVASGSITHALAISYPFTKSGGPVAPATASDGITDSAEAIPIGARIQLDPGLDLATLALTPAERAIALALQTYGAILVDTGGHSGIGLYAVDPDSVSGDPWAGTFDAVDFPILAGIPVDRLRVLAFGAQDPDWSESSTLPDNRCATYLSSSH